ncbi:MAG TPA: hypothetical protein VKV29_07725 [Chthonomonas sp.]|jgi:hypothetical protein|nr:hypothetical protein [Chthonomonas sp.]HLH80156.1 hypothetical protein [Chthonomonas sp.]
MEEKRAHRYFVARYRAWELANGTHLPQYSSNGLMGNRLGEGFSEEAE